MRAKGMGENTLLFTVKPAGAYLYAKAGSSSSREKAGGTRSE
jgi:uncharacterized lipoprotein YddW (UPF0748 family)